MSQPSFADLGVSDAVVRALAARGVTAPFEVQRSVVPDVLAGHDVLVQSPTGSGKTLAFGVPLVDRVEAEDARAAALVLVPTRELASQVTDDLRAIATARALSLTAVYGGAGIERQAKLARRAHILVATPGRLEDLVQRGAIRLDSVRVLVLDEADRMLDMGFRPAVDRIVALTPADRQTLFFSATLEGATGPRRRRLHPQRHAATSSRRASAPRAASSTASSRWPTSPSSTRWSTSSPRATADARSCSCAPSAGRTASSSGSRATACTHWRSTATARSRSARRRWRASTRAPSTRLSPRTSRRAASTSTT